MFGQEKEDCTMTRNGNRTTKRLNRSLILVFALLATGLLPTAYCLLPTASASDPGGGDWPMWGGTPDRNMISNMKRSEEHTSELQSLRHLVCRLLLEKKKKKQQINQNRLSAY